MEDPHAAVKQHRLRIFLDMRELARGLRGHLSFAAARRHAEYVLIDYRRVTLDAADRVARALSRLARVQDGMGFSAKPAALDRNAQHLLPAARRPTARMPKLPVRRHVGVQHGSQGHR